MSKIHFLTRPPKDVYLAFSGGVDSVVMLHTLIRRKYNVVLLTVDHGNEFAKQEVEFCKQTALKYNLEYKIFTIPEFDKSTSLEAFWSNHRNQIFQSMDRVVIVCHHLDDALEWMLMSTFQGTPKLTEHINRNVQRPMITTSKKTILEYANKYNLTYLTDPTNLDPNFNLRNKVRLQLVGNVQSCFPGIRTTVKRLIIQKHLRGLDNPHKQNPN
jgi:tRNA(Ile)-lysidine synthetase-like protein